MATAPAQPDRGVNASSSQPTLIPIVVGVAGHRDLPPEALEGLRNAVRGVLRELREQHPDTPLFVASSLAEGADRLVVRVAIEENARLIAVLPMPQLDYEIDFPESREDFRGFLDVADSVITIPDASDRCAEAGSSRDFQYALASAWIVRHSHILVALWDGRDLGRPAGTAQAVSFMLHGIRPPHITHANELLATELGPVCWVVSPRISSESPLDPFDVKYLIGQRAWKAALERTDSQSDEIRASQHEDLTVWRGRLSRIDGFNRSCRRFGRDITLDPCCVLEELQKVPGGLSPRETRLATSYLTADALAVAFRHSTMDAIVTLVLLVLGGFTSLQLFLEIAPLPLVLSLYPLALSLAAALYIIVRRRNIQDNYLECRSLAEGQRVQLFWAIAGLPDEAVEAHLRHYEGVSGWVADALRAWAAVHAPHTPADSHHARKRVIFVLRAWVRDQREYFQRAKRREHRAHMILGRGSLAIYSLSVGAALAWVLAYAHVEPAGHWKHALTLIIALGVAVSAALEAISRGKGYAEHSKNYERMERIYSSALNVCCQRLRASRGLEKGTRLNGPRAILRALGETALGENANWLTLHRSRPIDAPRG